MNELQVLQEMSGVYGRCSSYEDQGYVDSISDPGTTEERRERVLFRTFFRRPNLYRIEWRKHDPYSKAGGSPDDVDAIWCDGTRAFATNHFAEGVQECESLDHAIATAASVSAHNVSSLLMPEMLSFRFMRHGTLTSAGDEVVMNDESFHFLAVTNEQRTDMWISKANRYLRRVREDRLIKGGQTSMPELPPGISAAEQEEMMRILSESAMEDLHSLSDCYYTHIRFDSPIADSMFHLQPAAG